MKFIEMLATRKSNSSRSRAWSWLVVYVLGVAAGVTGPNPSDAPLEFLVRIVVFMLVGEVLLMGIRAAKRQTTRA